MLAAGAALAGCAPRGPARGSAAPSPTEATTPPDAVVTALSDALTRGDRPAFVGAFVPTLTLQAGVLFDNARTLGGFVLGPLVGDQVGVTWRVADERHAASTHLTLTADASGRVASLRPPAGESEPVWWRHPVVVTRDGGALLVTTRDRAAASAPWVASAARAAAHLADAGVARSPDAWDGRLVVEMPHDLLSFDAPPSVACYVHALAGGALRAVLNPTLSGYDDSDRLALMVHEGAHVVIDSPRLAAPLWLVEGMAESLALDVSPKQAAAASETVARLKAAGVDRIPADPDFHADDPDAAGAAYALAAVAHRGCVRRWGDAAVQRWLHDWDGTRPPTPAQVQVVLDDELARR